MLEPLTASQHEELLGGGKAIALEAKTLLYEADAPMDFMFFPESGFASIVVPLGNGSAVEAMTIGYDGFVGLPAYLGDDSPITRTIVQCSGLFHKIPAASFLRIVEHNFTLKQRIHQYAQITMETLAQSSACNRFHSIEQRCARWLLISHDRALAESFELTQDFLSQMIGVRRPGVTVAASALQKAGLISYKRGRISIINRPGLERAACECYRRIKLRETKIFGLEDAANSTSAA